MLSGGRLKVSYVLGGARGSCNVLLEKPSSLKIGRGEIDKGNGSKKQYNAYVGEGFAKSMG